MDQAGALRRSHRSPAAPSKYRTTPPAAVAPRGTKRKANLTPSSCIVIPSSDDEGDGPDRGPSRRARGGGAAEQAAAGASAAAPAAAGGGPSVVQLSQQLASCQQQVTQLQVELKQSAANVDHGVERVKAMQKQINELEDNTLCPICIDRRRSVAFTSCGHTACATCAAGIRDCHTCRKKIAKRLTLF